MIHTEVRGIPADQLTIDPQVQRQIDPRRVNMIAAEWDDLMVGVLTVSHRVFALDPFEDAPRPDEFVVLDGQTRLAAFRKVCGEHTSMPMLAEIHTGLAQAEEAEIFLKHNNRKAVQITDRFRLAVVAGQQWAVDIAEVLAKHNWTVRGVSVDGEPRRQFGAVRAAETVYKAGGREALERTFTTIENAWGSKNRDAVSAPVLYGLGMLFARHPELDSKSVASLVRKLSKIPAGQFIGQVAQDARRYSKSVRYVAQEFVLEIYNRGKKDANRLS